MHMHLFLNIMGMKTKANRQMKLLSGLNFSDPLFDFQVWLMISKKMRIEKSNFKGKPIFFMDFING